MALILSLLLSINMYAITQDKRIISGVVTTERGEPLIGATVRIKGSSIGTTTNRQGAYQLSIPGNQAVIIFSHLGYKSAEIQVDHQETINISLKEDAHALSELVVTGVFNSRSRMESSIAVSILDSSQLNSGIPVSAADLLKNVPGVYVNSALGEIRNTVYSRGVSVGSTDGAVGYYYVSMQENGLPVTNATFGNYGPDYFLRADATLQRVEAVRGGTASILGNNAPGGIFNYVSKTGGNTFSGELSLRYGLEGNGQNPYYRADASFGGPIARNKTLTYHVGGFFRRSDGARYPGYPMNNGGQIKANIQKQYRDGTVTLYLKYLNDHNGWFEFLPTVDFNSPKLPEGMKATTSVLIPPVMAHFNLPDNGGPIHFDSRKNVNSIDRSIGLNWAHQFGLGWSFDNKVRYSDKSSVFNSSTLSFPFAVNDLFFFATIGQLGQFGLYSFRDLQSGQALATVTQAPAFFNGQFVGINTLVNQSELPGASIQKNSVLFHPLFYTNNRMHEFIDQFTLTKRTEKMVLTAGAFYARSSLNRHFGSPGVAFGTITDPRPRLVSLSSMSFDGKMYQLTNPDGVIGASGSTAAINKYGIHQQQLAAFVGHNWSITSRFNLDWGLRWESLSTNGSNTITTYVASPTGGVDGNPLTVYDNNIGTPIGTFGYDKKVTTLSFSGALSYKINEKYNLYGRYSKGQKAPDMDIYVNVNTPALQKLLNPLAQKTQQIELGMKAQTSKATFFLTPFLSILSNVPIQQAGLETNDLSTLYATPVLYNKYVTKGIELESNYQFNKHFGIRGVATWQTSRAVDYQLWDLGSNGRADDKILRYSGNKTDNIPALMVRLTPTYTIGKFRSALEWSYMGKRAANVVNAFNLPAFSQTNITAAYQLNRSFRAAITINNVLNTFGVMNWAAPGGFPAAIYSQNFTKAQLDANPNAIYSTISIPPRAFFLNLTYTL